MATDIESRFEAKKKKPRHWLHLILTAATFGAYAPVWMICAAIAQKHNEGIDNQCKGYLLAVADMKQGATV